jgi:hypothetical protein
LAVLLQTPNLRAWLSLREDVVLYCRFCTVSNANPTPAKAAARIPAATSCTPKGADWVAATATTPVARDLDAYSQ